MKNKLSYVVIAVLAALLAFGFVYAASQSAVENSQACEHASETGKEKANSNSVLSSCVPQVCPPCTIGTPPDCVSIC